jgi:translocation and assembly module TamB
MRRALRILAFSFAGVAGFVVVAGAALFGVAQTEYGRREAARLLESVLAGPGETVRIGRLDGVLPGEVRAYDIEFADRRGVWLAVAELRLDWSVAELLARRLHVRELALSGVRLERPSEADAGKAGEPASLPPVDVVVDRLSVTGLALGEAFVGERATLDVRGSAALVGRGERASLDLAVERRDRQSGRFNVRLVHAQAPPEFSVDVDIDEPAGGLLARLAGLPGASGVSARISGAGPPAAWRGQIAAALEGHARFSGTLEASVADGTRVRLVGETTLEGAATATARQFVGDRVPLALQAVWRPRQRIELEHARIGAGRFEAGGSGVLHLEDRRLDAKLGVLLRDIAADRAAGSPVAIGRLSIDAALAGPLAAPAAMVQIAAGSVAAPEASVATIAATLEAKPVGGTMDTLDFAGSGTFEGVRSEIAALAPLLGPKVAWSFAGRRAASGRIALSSFAADAEAVRLRGSVTVEPEGTALAGRIEASLTDLAAALPDVGVAGPAGVAADFRLRDGAAAADVEVNAAPKLSEPALARLVGDRIEAHAKIERAADGSMRVAVPPIRLPSGSIGLDATAQSRLERLEARTTVALDDLALLSFLAGVDLSGAATVDGTVQGAPDDLAADVRLTGRKIVVAGNPLDAFVASLAATRKAGRIDGKLTAKAARGGDTVDLVAPIVLTDARIDVRDFSLVQAANRLGGSLGMRRSDGRMEGRVTGRLDSLASLGRLAGVDASGTARLEARLSAKEPQDLSLDVSGRDLDLDGESGAQSVDFTLRARVRDSLAAASGQARLTASGVRAGGAAFDMVSLQANGGLREANLSGLLSGSKPQRTALGFAGTAKLDGAEQRFTLARLDGAYGSARFALARPATLVVGRDSAILSLVEINAGQGRIRVAGKVRRDDLDADLSVAKFPLRLVRAFAPGVDVEGTLAAEAKVTGTRARPEARLDATIDGLRPAGDRGGAIRSHAESEAVLDGRIQARLRAGELAIDARAANGRNVEMALAATAAVLVDPKTLSPSIAPDRPISAHAAGAVQVAWLTGLLGALDGDTVGGKIAIDLRAEGQVGSPRLSGQVTLDNGRYESALTGAVVRNLSARIEADQGSIRLVSLAGDDGDGGKIEADGRFEVDPDRRFPLDFAARISGFRVMRSDEAKAQLTGPITVSGNLDRMAVRGTLDVDPAEFYIPEKLPSSVVRIDVEEVNGPESKRPPAAERGGAAPTNVELNVTVRIPNRAFVRGRGLTSEWKGDIHIGGTADAPVVEGKIEVNRGTFVFAGKPFVLTKGDILFDGSKEAVPDLDIAAQHKLKDALAVIQVTGRATSPDIELTSVPPMSQEEILSRVLFGTSTGQLTPMQAIDLAASAAALSGAGGSVGIFDRIRSSMGLDVLTVESEGGTAKGSSLKAGKYVADGVYVSAGRGVEQGSAKVGVEIEVTPNISVDTQVGGDAQGNVGIHWKWDY